MSFSAEKHYELMVRSAYYYYKQQLTQTEIASMLGISRLSLGRILKDARDEGVVTIEINDRRNLLKCLECEIALKEKYGLKNAVVAPEAQGGDVEYAIAKSAAEYISSVIRPGMTVSLAWGKTINTMVNILPENKNIKDLNVLTLVGGGGTTDSTMQPGMLAGSFLSKYNGSGYVINAPFFCRSEESCASIKKEPGVADVLKRCAESDISIVGIGEKPHTKDDYWAYKVYGQAEIERIISQGAVGDICGIYINAGGNECCDNITGRIVAASLEDLKKSKCVIALAGGRGKCESVKAALAGNYIDVLITDLDTAGKLIDVH